MERLPFRKLPAELRLDIYKRCLTVDGSIGVDFRKAVVIGRYNGKDEGDQILTITGVCKQMHLETEHLFVTLNRVRLHIDENSRALQNHRT